MSKVFEVNDMLRTRIDISEDNRVQSPFSSRLPCLLASSLSARSLKLCSVFYQLSAMFTQLNCSKRALAGIQLESYCLWAISYCLWAHWLSPFSF